ncbi:unnamed protein product [Trichogramma brassicae]|uniref:Sulfotransferase domain-containing protein n=1 Tax=Trichogramma brassicae TaxID=86971 RepID=A0A6H5ISU4_9HYME|nr:unnamed protein product [Trichogramma brassicae]
MDLDNILSLSISPEVPIRYMNYHGMFVPDSYQLIADSIENFQIRDDDVWVCSFPKAGTTWTQEMVWNIGNNFDPDTAKTPLPIKFPFVEFTGTTTTGWISLNKADSTFPDHMSKSVEYATNLPSPRFLKTHLPFNLLPKQLRTREKKSKMIYVARNPKDVCISYYHHYKLLEGYCSTFENFSKLFLGDKVYYAPFWDHVISYWDNKGNNDILFLTYENMKKDLGSVIQQTAAFLNKSPMSPEQLNRLKEHLSFDSMKKNPAANYENAAESINASKIFGENFKAEGVFIRKGEYGQWKSFMSPELIERFDEWTKLKLKNHRDLFDRMIQI